MFGLPRSDRWALASLCATACLGFAAWAFPNMTRFFTVPAAIVCGILAIYFGWIEIAAAFRFVFARKRIHLTVAIFIFIAIVAGITTIYVYRFGAQAPSPRKAEATTTTPSSAIAAPSLSPSLTPFNPAQVPSEIPAWLAMATNEQVRRLAFNLSGEIGHLLNVYNTKLNTIIGDKKLTDDLRADQVEILANNASEDFKTRYAYRYVLLQVEMLKRINNPNLIRYEFGQALVNFNTMAACAAQLKYLGRLLP